MGGIADGIYVAGGWLHVAKHDAPLDPILLTKPLAMAPARVCCDGRAQALEEAAADAAFKLKMGAAFAALMLFVFIVFIFLFVRIERNLRVVRVVQADEHA